MGDICFGVLGHLCSKLGQMTLPSRHKIQNTCPGGLRPSMLPLGLGGSPRYWIFMSEQGRKILFLQNLKGCGVQTRDLPYSKQAAFTTAPGPPPTGLYPKRGSTALRCFIPDNFFFFNILFNFGRVGGFPLDSPGNEPVWLGHQWFTAPTAYFSKIPPPLFLFWEKSCTLLLI